eukprot:3995072-Pleurochrysis_carterae.AAC.1
MGSPSRPTMVSPATTPDGVHIPRAIFVKTQGRRDAGGSIREPKLYIQNASDSYVGNTSSSSTTPNSLRSHESFLATCL